MIYTLITLSILFSYIASMLWMYNNTYKAELSPYWDYVYTLEGEFIYQIFLN